MAHGWVKSLQCRARAFEDVHVPSPRRAVPPAAASSSCRSSSQAIKDVVDTARQKYRRPKPGQRTLPSPAPACPKPKNSPKTELRPPSSALPLLTPAGILFPALTELPEGHPSRRVVEIIFHTSWGPKAFSGRVEIIFKVQNGQRATARFEEYRETVQSRAGLVSSGSTWEDDARCIADGNEMMRFQSVGPMPLGDAAHNYPGAWGCLQRGKVAAICTYSGSGQAHESSEVTGRPGRRAMLVCRVVAGRVAKRAGIDPYLESRVGFDSMSGDNGNLLVYDSRAVLPCFLIIYRL
ncbi:uncharacterized protein LOC116195360 [Punica granatum]|uniref:Uncharacterized protein LOC116195360 n=1 Tax=Punica granatum TaxID=22663 RepID=A0A218WG68_PUNGR|nr:uncharacterized protein LOC116195360 [Punica granatum]OWM71825.1 hypothetical protein CDL15_Pgr017708 [Punica granatum]